MAEIGVAESQERVGAHRKVDSNRGPKDNGSRPAAMPEQPHVGTLRKKESNPGVSRGGALPEPIVARGPTKSRS